MASWKAFFKAKIVLICLFSGLIFFGNIHGVFTKKGMIDIDTPYNKVWISYETQVSKAHGGPLYGPFCCAVGDVPV